MRRVPVCVLVRDARYPVGGFETWVETLAESLPERGIRTVVLNPGGSPAVASRFDRAESIAVPVAEEASDQARHVVEALSRLAGAGLSGVFFTMGYPYLNVAGLNLQDSPWCAVPVLHGRHPSDYPWIVAGPPRRIVVPSRDYFKVVRRELRRRVRWFRAAGQVICIPHGVRVPQAAEGKLRQSSPAVPRVVAVTRFDEDAKRASDFIRIALRCREIGLRANFAIAGTGPAETEMREMAGDVVEFAGALRRDEVFDFLLGSDVFISTSEREAFGLSVAEALACGCAVIAARAEGTVTEMTLNGGGLLVEPGDIPGFVQAIAAIAPVARIAGRIGRDYVSTVFPEALMVDRYASLIRSVTRRYVRPERTWRVPEPMLLSPDELTLPPVSDRLRRFLLRPWL